MASDVIPQIAEQVLCIGDQGDAVDLLVVSNGGDPTVAWRTISVLRERFTTVGVLLPFSAYSAATLPALGANEVVMRPFANLGPVGIQLVERRRVSGPDGHPTGETEETVFGSEDVRHFLELLRNDVGITDQVPLERAFEPAIRDFGAIAVGSAKRGTNLALSMESHRRVLQKRVLASRLSGGPTRSRGRRPERSQGREPGSRRHPLGCGRMWPPRCGSMHPSTRSSRS